MKRRRGHGGWVGLGLLALGLACGKAESSTLVLPDAGAAASAGDEALDEVAADAGGALPLEEGPCAENGVARRYFTLTTPAEIAALAGCREIDGNLSVVAFPGIDTSPLGSLRRVTGELHITGTDQDDEPHLLEGFRQLESVGGLGLYNLRLADLSAFGRLRAVESPPTVMGGTRTFGAPTGALAIMQCSGLTSLAGLGALEQVHAVSVQELPELTSLTGLDSLRELEGLDVHECPVRDLRGLDGIDVGALSVRGSQLRDLSGLHMSGGGLESALYLERNPALTSLGGWQAPAELFEIVLRGNGALVDLRGLEGLTSLYYATIAEEAALVSLAGLDGLSSVGELSVSEIPRLQNLTGLDTLREVGQLSIFGNESFGDLTGLAPGVEIERLSLLVLRSLRSLLGLGNAAIGSLTIQAVPLVDLRGLEQATLSDGLVFIDLPELTSLEGFPAVPDWSSFGVTLMQCPAFRDLGALASVSQMKTLCLSGTDVSDLDALASLRVAGDVTLTENPRLAQIDGVGALERLEQLEIGDNPALRALPSFAALVLECVDCPSGLRLHGNAALESVGPWPWLTSGYLQVVDNPALVSISVPGLRSSGLLEVTGNTSLTTLDLSSLEEAGSLTVMGNPAFDDAALIAIAQGSSFAQVKITSNLGGALRLAPCPWVDDSVCDEVTEICAPGTDTLDCAGDR